uniref:Uncharacterized protein n=1 Tax=Spongospora subterranea TaxID=70186 RepID=A0A0H5R9X5_9EUKA|eukprot:CRZ10893.1 hypothetical protein [Spongospora subterranea]
MALLQTLLANSMRCPRRCSRPWTALDPPLADHGPFGAGQIHLTARLALLGPPAHSRLLLAKSVIVAMGWGFCHYTAVPVLMARPSTTISISMNNVAQWPRVANPVARPQRQLN